MDKLRIRLTKSAIFCLTLFLLSTCNPQKEPRKESLNRLANASSPYLKEHSDNPVDWYEWGSEALGKSNKEGKPLIVSIGYASCHWCHVMEEESFMDTAVARIMNENFVSIKIDREERPDIDQIYITAAQLISGNAGWPLNVFALPDGKPFYAATYFPKDQWIKMLRQIMDMYKKDHDNVVKQAEALTKGIQTQDLVRPMEDSQVNFNQKYYHDIFASWEPYFDFKSGGISGSPKFPMPIVLEFLLQNYYLTGNKKALELVNTSLNAMANGGINDQLGGGFSRYSTDSIWSVPHFEKMLYDNAQLVSLYSHAYQQSKNPMYQVVIHETLEFIKNELTNTEGGFYSSLNADSEGKEGKFYGWRKAEIDSLLDEETANLITEYYDVTDVGNWEVNNNILQVKITTKDFAREHSMSTEQWEMKLSVSRKTLLKARSKRIHPSLDNKVLTSWNALMLTGYVDAYFATGRKEYLEAALNNAEFIENNLLRGGGRLWRTVKDNKSSVEAFMEDYSLLAKAYIHLYEATFDIHWLDRARSVVEYSIKHFRDEKSGLFYLASDQSENLIARKMELTDQVIPSSNSVTAEVLYKLGKYYDQKLYEEMAHSMLNQVANDITKNGPYYANWASLMGMFTFQPVEVAIMGEEALDKSFSLHQRYLPMAIFMGGDKEDLPLLENKLVKGKTIIYVCQNKTCKLPVEKVDQAVQQLK